MAQRLRIFWSVDFVLATTLMALAGYLRFARLELASFNFDEARALELAADILEKDPFTARGLPSSVGIVNSAAFPYLLTIPLLFSSSPLWATGFIALLNTLAVGGCYVLARRWFGLGPAVIAASLYALNLWAVDFSRKIWAQNLLSTFTVGILFCLFLYQKGRRPWWGVAAMLVWAVAIQTHFSAAALLPLMAVSLVTGLNRDNIRKVLSGILLFLAAFAPVLFSDTGGSWNRLPEVLSRSRFDMSSWRLTLELVMGGGGSASVAVRIIPLLAAAGAINIVDSLLRWPHLDDGNWRRMVIGIASISAPLVFMFQPGGQLYIYYLLTVWPASSIVVGILLGDAAGLVRRFSTGRRSALAVYWAVLALWLLVLASTRISGRVQSLRLAGIGEGLNVGRVSEIVEAVHSIQISGDVYLVNLYRHQAAALRYILRDQYHVRESLSRESESVAVRRQPTVLVFRAEDNEIIQEIESRVAGQLVRRVSLDGDSRVLLLYQVDYEDALEQCQQTPTEGLTFDGQVTLAGVHLQPADNGDILVMNCWRVHQLPAELSDQLKVFNHLVDRDGEKVTQADGLGHLPSQWREGDIILNYYLMPIPAGIPDGEYHLLTGMYRLDTSRRIPISQDGQFAEQVQTGPYGFEKGVLQPDGP